MVFALISKAIAASQIAVVRDLQAESLHDGRALRKFFDGFLVRIFGKKRTGCLQTKALSYRLGYLRTVVTSVRGESVRC